MSDDIISRIPRRPLESPMLQTMAILYELENAAFEMARKFHAETSCGDDNHWAECERLAAVFGHFTFDQWALDVRMRQEAELTLYSHDMPKADEI